MITYRLAQLRKFLDEKKVNAVLIKKLANVNYFSGFTGDSTILIITHKKNILVTDGRYLEQARNESPKFELVEQTDSLLNKVCEVLKEIGLTSVGFEENDFTVAEFNKICDNVPKIKMTPLKLDELRQVKDEFEIEKIKIACEIADKAFEKILDFIKPGIREIEVAAELEYQMRKLGSQKAAFDTIVASGVRGTLPHGIASEKKIKSGEFVTMDFGAIYQHYHSDITRTVFVGHADGNQKKIYNTLLEAQTLGLQAIEVGKSGKEIDKVVRDFLERFGFEKYFIHGLGHGVGLEIHEEPRISKYSQCEKLLANMIVTDEPGIYIPEMFGMRIEDTVLITDDCAIPLTKSPKHLIELY